METQNPSVQNACIRAGCLTAAGLIFYFSLMRFFNLHHIMELRILNIVFLASGIAYALNYMRKATGVDYLQGLGAGLFTTIIAIGIFDVFMGLYLTAIDPAFMEYLQKNAFFGSYLTPVSIMGVLLAEGGVSGAMLTFILMQYYKRYHMSR